MQEKCIEKLSLFTHSESVIYDGDDPLIVDSAEKMCMGTREIAWSRKDKDRALYISKIVKGEDSTRIDYVEDASIEDAIHCLAVMLYLGKTGEEIAARMCKLEPVAMRMEVKEGRNGCLIINDSYNSDINSLDIALDFQNRRSE